MSTATHAQKQQFENGSRWRWLSKTVISWNPICQAIEPGNGEQCRSASRITHHLVDPEDCWELRLTVSNLCAVCPRHHAGGAKGDNFRLDYTPTREAGAMGAPDVYHHHKPFDRRTSTTTTLSAHEWEAHERKEEAGRIAWEAWKKSRQAQATAAETSNPTREATDIKATALT